MSCVRNSVLSMLCLVASCQYTCGLRVSLQNLDFGVSRSHLYSRQSSSANAGVPSQNLTLPPNPFIFESAAGYIAGYTIKGRSTFPRASASRLITYTMAALEQQRQVEGEDITGPIPGGGFRVTMEALEQQRQVEGEDIASPIPGGSFRATKSGPGFVLTWEIDQEGVRTTENLTYQHAEIALQGTRELIGEYDYLVRQYEFSLWKTRSMQLVANGYLKSVQDAVTD